MAIKQYKLKIIAGEDVFWHRPSRISIPTDSKKYIRTTWRDDYTWFRLSYFVYGTTNLYWLLMKINNITDPYNIKNGDELVVLRPEYLNEVLELEANQEDRRE